MRRKTVRWTSIRRITRILKLSHNGGMGIPIMPYPVALDRFASLLTAQARRLSRR
ncbi:MAG: hypothetical protein U5R30_01045 [Deltaproteobacteria bacterium]|nr:hypothetical protein [Deltaproteobacteria bacterium]